MPPRRMTDEDNISVELPRSPWETLRNVGALLGTLAIAATVVGTIWVTNADVAEIPVPIDKPEDHWLKRPYAVLKWHPPRTCLLWECGYASNPSDLDHLADPGIQWAIARSVVDGVGEYLVQVGLVDETGHYIPREYEHERSTDNRGREPED